MRLLQVVEPLRPPPHFIWSLTFNVLAEMSLLLSSSATPSSALIRLQAGSAGLSDQCHQTDLRTTKINLASVGKNKNGFRAGWRFLTRFPNRCLWEMLFILASSLLSSFRPVLSSLFCLLFLPSSLFPLVLPPSPSPPYPPSPPSVKPSR